MDPRPPVWQIAAMDSDRMARDRDRDAAIRLVENAWADGQIVELDRDKRVEELRRALTVREIEMLVHDLRPVGYAQPPAAPPTPAAEPTPTPTTYATYPGNQPETDEDESAGAAAPVWDRPAPQARVMTWHVSTSRRPRRSGRVRGRRGVVLAPILFLAGAAVVGNLLSDLGTPVDLAGVPGDSPTLAPGQEPADGERNLFSARGYDAMVTDLEEGTGRSEVFTAMLHPTYATMQVPVDATSRQQRTYRWDGALDVSGSKSTSTEPRFELRDVDPTTVARLVQRVRTRVEDPTTWYAILHAPSQVDGSLVEAYATNDVGETAYVVATGTGKVLYADSPEAGASR